MMSSYVISSSVVPSLSEKVALKLIAILSYKNVCYIMNYPSCFKVFELDVAISYILQSESDKVLASPYFLELNLTGFVKFLEMEMMNVPEIELWKAAFKWAKHRAKCEEGPELRKELAKPLKYIRICTLSLEDFHQEVTPTGVLTDAEVRMVCSSLRTKEVQEQLTDICNEVVPRKLYPTKITSCVETFGYFHNSEEFFLDTSLFLRTDIRGIELLSVGFLANDKPPNVSQETYKCEGCFKLARVTGVPKHLSSKLVLQFNFCETVKYSEVFSVSLRQNGRNIFLFPYASYEIMVIFSQPHTTNAYNIGSYFNGNFSVLLTFNPDDIDEENGFSDYGDMLINTHINNIAYRALEF